MCMLGGITKQLIKRPWLSLSILAILFIALGFQATNLAIDPSFDTLISPDGEYNTQQRYLEAAFEQNGGVFITFGVDEKSRLKDRPVDLRETTLEEDVEEFRALLEESQYVIATSPLQYSRNGELARIGVAVQEPNTKTGLKEVKEELDYYASEARLPSGIKAEVTGLPVVLDRITTLLITDNLKTILITAALVFLVLLIYFRDIRLSLIGVTAPLLSLIALAASMVALDIGVTLTLAAVGVIVVGLGADYSIHLISAYERYLSEGHPPEQSIIESLDELEVPLIAAFLTTAAGFAALMLGISPSSQAQGTVLTLAITIIFVTTFLVLPVLLVSFVKKPCKGGVSSGKLLNNVYDKLSHYQSSHPYRVIVFVLIITGVMLIGASSVYFSTSNSNWIPDDDPISLSFRELEYAYGPSESVSIVIRSTALDLREPQTVRDIQELTTKLKGIPGVTVSSPFEGVAINNAEIIRHVEQEQIRAQFSRDYTLTRVTISSEGFEVDEAGNSEIIPEVQSILDRTPIHNAETGLFGDPVRFNELGTSLQQDTAVTTMLGLAFVFTVAAIMYTSFAIGVVALAPIIIAVLWAVGLMGFFGVPFTSLSTGIVSLVLGIGVDFSLHITSSIRHQRDKGLELKDAIEEALHTTGGAILLSSITTFFGFLALTLATLLGTQRLGWSLGLSILAVFIVCILFVPAVVAARASVLGKGPTKTARKKKT